MAASSAKISSVPSSVHVPLDRIPKIVTTLRKSTNWIIVEKMVNCLTEVPLGKLFFTYPHAL